MASRKQRKRRQATRRAQQSLSPSSVAERQDETEVGFDAVPTDLPAAVPAPPVVTFDGDRSGLPGSDGAITGRLLWQDVTFAFPQPGPRHVPGLRWKEVEQRWMPLLIVPAVMMMLAAFAPGVIVAASLGALAIGYLEPRLRLRGYLTGAVLAGALTFLIIYGDEVTTTQELLAKASALLQLGCISAGFVMMWDLLRRYAFSAGRLRPALGDGLWSLGLFFGLWGFALGMVSTMILIASTGLQG